MHELLGSLQELKCNTSVKVYFLHSHLDYFSENLEAKQGLRFQQDLKTMGKRYEGRQNKNMPITAGA